MNLLTLLPMAVVMVAGPQFVNAVFLATSDHPKRGSTCGASIAFATPAELRKPAPVGGTGSG